MDVRTKIGRNDPCYCGSGRKYKRCHLPLDEKARLDARPPAPEEPIEPDKNFDSEPTLPNWRGGLGQFRNYKEVFKMAARSSFFKHDPKLRQIVQENETLLNFLGSEQEIEAAGAELGAHEEEFRKLLEDQAAFSQRCEEVFSEEAFAPLRFRAADLERAFQQVGFPADQGTDEDLSSMCEKAVCFLATKEHRSHLSMELMLRLPKYVEQGRYLDGCLVEFMAQETSEREDEINPFLMRMFRYGIGQWEDKREEEQKALLRELGLDVSSDMGPEEIDAWVAEQSADPTKTARLEELMAARPTLFRGVVPSFQAMAELGARLLTREDAKCLWLSREEIETWAPFLMEKLQLMLEKYGPDPEHGKVPEERQAQAFSRIFLPALQQVANGIFTTERIKELVSDLRAYRNRLFAEGEKTASYWAMQAINYVEPENDPSKNLFLVHLCFRSICQGEPSMYGQRKDDRR